MFSISLEGSVLSWSDGCASVAVACTYCTIKEKGSCAGGG